MHTEPFKHGFVNGGGQSEFLELLPALVSNVTVTIYVIDLSRKPDNFCNDFFYY